MAFNVNASLNAMLSRRQEMKTMGPFVLRKMLWQLYIKWSFPFWEVAILCFRKVPLEGECILKLLIMIPTLSSY